MKGENKSHICKDCLKWESFGKNCWVHWEWKKFCTQKVTDRDAWDREKRLLR